MPARAEAGQEILIEQEEGLNRACPSILIYLAKALKSSKRVRLRKKFKIADKSAPIDLQIVSDASPVTDEIYRLYLQVFEKAAQRFEELTKSYFVEIGRRMPDKARFFIWRQEGRIIAFGLCLVEGNTLYAEYLGLDYSIALKIHLYFYVMRDIIAWGIENGFTSIVSSGLSYWPKLQMGHLLEPVDLYVRHTSPALNAILKLVLPGLEPTRKDKTLKLFANYGDLWASPR